MATIIISGQRMHLPSNQAVDVQERLRSLKPGETMTYWTGLGDDTKWALIPYGCPVVIEMWDSDF